MLTISVCSQGNTEGGLFPTYKIFLTTFKKLRNYAFLSSVWGCSSAGEHMTEDHGVGGSTPPTPIKNRVRTIGFDRASSREIITKLKLKKSEWACE